MKVVSFVMEAGEKRGYINGASSNQDCESLARYFEKYWDATFEAEFDVGTDARYTLAILNHDCLLVHSQLGNYVTCSSGDVETVLKAPLADLEKRLGS